MPKFRKLPVEIEAMQVPRFSNSAGWPELREWLSDDWQRRDWYQKDNGILINTLEGDHLARFGDWIIRGITDEIYPCKPDIFAATYEPVLSDDKRTELDGRAQSAVEQVQDY